ncbi:MAG: ATP-binding protein [Pyrobaculum sp.]
MRRPSRLFTRKVARIDPSRCRRCNLCVKSCPVGALKPPAVATSLCVGCGICTYSCPLGAISIHTVASRGALAAVLLILLIAGGSLYLAVSTPSYYANEATTINFTTIIVTPTFTPINATMPTGEGAAGAGSGFG